MSLQLFCRVRPSGAVNQRLVIDGCDVLVLRPSYFSLTGLYSVGYYDSVRAWSLLPARAALLVEGRCSSGASIFYCAEFRGTLRPFDLGTDVAPQVGELVGRAGALRMRLQESGRELMSLSGA